MKSIRSKHLTLGLIPLFGALLLLSGCGTIRLDASAEGFPIAAKVVPSYKAGQTINVNNYYDKPVIIKIYGNRLDADLKQYTDVAMKLLEQGLNHQKISVGRSGSKTVKLRVHNVVYVKRMTGQMDVDITTDLGNGKSFTVHHHNASPFTTRRAINGAITRATEKVLRHPEFIEYMIDESEAAHITNAETASAPIAVTHERNVDTTSAWLDAAREGNVETIRTLLQLGADIEIQTDSGNSALKIACKNNHLALAEFLISKGADINSQSEEKGTTPLHAAAYRGHLDLVMLLLKHGAKIDLRTKKGNTPLMLARKKKYHDVVKALQRARAGTTEIDF